MVIIVPYHILASASTSHRPASRWCLLILASSRRAASDSHPPTAPSHNYMCCDVLLMFHVIWLL